MMTMSQSKTLMLNQNFKVDLDTTKESAVKEYLESFEMLLLLNKVKTKKRLGNRIYLVLLHQKFKIIVKKVYMPDLEWKFLLFMGKLLGFRI